MPRKTNEALVKMFSMLFKSRNTDKVKQFVHLIQESFDDKQALVKVRGKNMIIPAGRIVQVTCKADVGFKKVKRAMLFQPGEINVPEGLPYAEAVVMLKSSTNNYFKIPVVNESSKDVVLHKNTEFGYLEPSNQLFPCKLKKEYSQLLTP